jgi:hypothetical protein
MRTLASPANRGPALRQRAIIAKPKRERRRNVRFPMTLPVRYSLAKSCGWGQIVNIGSGGALFTIDEPVKYGQRIELYIGWPVLLHETVHLSLVTRGTIVRAEEGRAAVRFGHFAFRTAGAAFRLEAALPEL